MNKFGNKPKDFFGYVRISNPRRQGEGTSLEQQKDAIIQFAKVHGYRIKDWFVEKETAAKQGRQKFNEMLRRLRDGEADGILLHKIDRGARNLKDWALLGDLIDEGFEVYFVNENIDLRMRGGRLSADLQAVIAADYIRNLREETIKGFYGRLKQGRYPFSAKIGYVSKGKGIKEPDPIQRHHVLKAFELAATGKWNLIDLAEHMYGLGLRNTAGGRVTKNRLHQMFHEPFYMGLSRIRKTGEIFQGNHEPIVPKWLFDQTQDVLGGKAKDKKHQHFFIYRKWVKCVGCGKNRVPEEHKNNVYYRCQTAGCSQTSIREELVETKLRAVLRELKFDEQENIYFRAKIHEAYQNIVVYREKQTQTLRLHHDQTKARLDRATNAFIDGSLEKEIYEPKKAELLLELKTYEEQLAGLNTASTNVLSKIEQILELANNAETAYVLANPQQKRDLMKIVTSNFVADGKSVGITLNYPFELIEKRPKITKGCAGEDSNLHDLAAATTSR